MWGLQKVTDITIYVAYKQFWEREEVIIFVWWGHHHGKYAKSLMSVINTKSFFQHQSPRVMSTKS